MTPEETKAMRAHVEAIAAILYQNTDPDRIQSLEGIEQTVRQHMLEHVSPQMGIFLFAQARTQARVDAEPSLAASETLNSQKNKRNG